MKTLFVKIYIVVTTFFFGVLMTGTVIAAENSTAISNALGSATTKVESVGSDEAIDSQYFKSDFTDIDSLKKAGKALAEEIEGEGAVLLKNDNETLPLSKGSKVSLFGVAAYDSAYTGKGSAASVAAEAPVSLKQGLENAGFKVNHLLTNFYVDNLDEFKQTGRWTSLKLNDASWTDITSNSTVENSINEYSDVAIFVFNRFGGEGEDYASTGVVDGTDGDTLKLSPNEISVLKGLKALKDSGKIGKIVVLSNSANQVESTYLTDASLGVDAALWIGTVGISGFNSVGKILSGEINPSGHLSDMHWYDHKANPVYINYNSFEYKGVQNFALPKGGNRKVMPKYSQYSVYQEGIYVGYRYAETRYADIVTGRSNVGTFDYNSVISHPFGYGDSYTDFEFSNYKVDKKDNVYEISVTVKNAGSKYSGKEVVQVYLQKPYTDFDVQRGIEKSAVDLVGFAKTKVLAPGESETVKVYVKESEFRVYDANFDKTYIITEGDYYLTAATDSHNAINNILASQGYSNLDQAGDKKLVEKIHLNYDKTKYSKSEATGNDITNLFDEADINKYSGKGDNSVTYVSRSNWTGTLPTSYAVLSMTEQLCADILAQNKYTEKDDIAYPTYGADNGLQLIDLKQDEFGNKIAYDDEKWDLFMDQLTWEQTCALLSNGLRRTAALTELGKPETVDHNGPAGVTEPYGKYTSGLSYGKVTYDEMNADKNTYPVFYPCAGILAATFNVELATKYGYMLGEDALWVGYSGFYGIAINTHRSPYQGRTYEYLSEDGFLAGIMAAYEVKALQAKGCNAYMKHFALNEQENQRFGGAVWLNEQTLREIYLRPYEITMLEANASNVMASYARIGAKYCPASKELLIDFLRGELGMTGLVVTDMYKPTYDKHNLPVLIMAGTNIPDGELVADAPFKGFEEGYGALANQMREAAKQILYSTVHSNAMNGISKNTKLVAITPDWMVALIIVDVSFGVLWLGGFGMLGFKLFKDSKKKKRKEQ